MGLAFLRDHCDPEDLVHFLFLCSFICSSASSIAESFCGLGQVSDTPYTLGVSATGCGPVACLPCSPGWLSQG